MKLEVDFHVGKKQLKQILEKVINTHGATKTEKRAAVFYLFYLIFSHFSRNFTWDFFWLFRYESENFLSESVHKFVCIFYIHGIQ